jgi:hypothetical protein
MVIRKSFFFLYRTKSVLQTSNVCTYPLEKPKETIYHINSPKKPLAYWVSQGKKLCLQVLGIAETGITSRVETQVRCNLIVTLMSSPSNRLFSPTCIRVPDNLLAKEWLKAKIGKCAGLEELLLEVKVIGQSEYGKVIRACSACVTRERKRHLKKIESKRNSKDISLAILPSPSQCNGTLEQEEEDYQLAIKELSSEITEADRQRIISLHCPRLLEFKEGQVTIPFRIICYCGHHDEKNGFLVEFTLRDEYTNIIIASGMTPPITIIDNHKLFRRKLTCVEPKTTAESSSSPSSPSFLDFNNPLANRKRRAKSHSEDEGACSDIESIEIGPNESTPSVNSSYLHEDDMSVYDATTYTFHIQHPFDNIVTTNLTTQQHPIGQVCGETDDLFNGSFMSEQFLSVESTK